MTTEPDSYTSFKSMQAGQRALGINRPPTKKQKQARARREMRLRDDAPATWPKVQGEWTDEYVATICKTLTEQGFAYATTDPWGDRWNHFTSIVVWYAPKKYVQAPAQEVVV